MIIILKKKKKINNTRKKIFDGKNGRSLKNDVEQLKTSCKSFFFFKDKEEIEKFLPFYEVFMFHVTKIKSNTFKIKFYFFF